MLKGLSEAIQTVAIILFVLPITFYSIALPLTSSYHNGCIVDIRSDVSIVYNIAITILLATWIVYVGYFSTGCLIYIILSIIYCLYRHIKAVSGIIAITNHSMQCMPLPVYLINLSAVLVQASVYLIPIGGFCLAMKKKRDNKKNVMRYRKEFTDKLFSLYKVPRSEAISIIRSCSRVKAMVLEEPVSKEEGITISDLCRVVSHGTDKECCACSLRLDRLSTHSDKVEYYQVPRCHHIYDQQCFQEVLFKNKAMCSVCGNGIRKLILLDLHELDDGLFGIDKGR